MRINYYSYLLTIIQYTTLPLMMWLMVWFSDQLVLLAIQCFGILIAIWALFEMQKSKINIAPTPRKNATLVQSGIYKWLRHPMYLSLLLVFVPMLIENQNYINFSIFAIFAINIIFKLEYEEKLLLEFFSGYKDYKSKSWKLIPFIY